MKKCWTCHELKKETEFHKKNGRCKSCYQKWYKKNRYRICESCGLKFNNFGRFCSNICKLNYFHKKNESGCWEWQGIPPKNGYFITREYGTKKNIVVHRLSYKVYKGDIPEGMLVCHKCDNRRCIAPDHLFLGDHKDNMYDAKKKGRLKNGNFRGSMYAHAKLNEEKVSIIKSMLREGVPNKLLAEKFNVSRPIISEIRHGKLWKHVE